MMYFINEHNSISNPWDPFVIFSLQILFSTLLCHNFPTVSMTAHMQRIVNFINTILAIILFFARNPRNINK